MNSALIKEKGGDTWRELRVETSKVTDRKSQDREERPTEEPLPLSDSFSLWKAKFEHYTGAGCTTRQTMYYSPIGYCSGNYKFSCTTGDV